MYFFNLKNIFFKKYTELLNADIAYMAELDIDNIRACLQP